MSEPKRGPGQPKKPPELKRRNVTFKLSPAVIAKLKTIKNKSQLIDKLLIEYFEKAS